MLIDIHCHILPKVDDGAESVEEAIAILKEARRQGVTHMIVTPHYRQGMFEPTMKRVLFSYHGLREIAKSLDIRLGLGCEYYRNENMVADLENRRRPTMLGSRYVLTEFSTNDSFATIRNCIYELTTNGFIPIIAHVERYFCCQKLEKVLELRDLGAWIQVNAESVLGVDGRVQKKFCHQLMKEDAIDFIASDTHNTSSRCMQMKKCAGYVAKKMGKDYKRKIFVENPKKIWESRCTVEKG